MKIVIANSVDLMSFDPTRAGKADTHIYFTLDGKGPFEVIVPAEGTTEEAIKAAVNAYAARWQKITSMGWEI